MVIQLGERLPTLGLLCCFLCYTLSVLHNKRRRRRRRKDMKEEIHLSIPRMPDCVWHQPF